MAWEKLPTDYTDAVWTGMKKYRQIENEDGTISFLDVTAYENKEKSFFGAKDANRMNEAVNNIMAVGVRGKNLLHNWCFADPVNRNGKETYTNKGTTIDRWELTNDAGLLSLTLYDMILLADSGDVWFRQYVANAENLAYKRVTLSALIGNKVYSASGVVPGYRPDSDLEVCLVGYPEGSLALYMRSDGSLSVQFRVVNGESIIIRAVKLEVGSVQTLAYRDNNGDWVLYDVPDYGEQYVICSQYDLTTGKLMGSAPVENNAGYHNCIYRGKYLGSAVSASQWGSINAGTFDDLYIGDYWTIGGVNYRIAAFDYYLTMGDDTKCNTHHVIIVPDTRLYNSVMNDTQTSVGGYLNSKMCQEGLNEAKTIINTAFGENHVLKMDRYLSNVVTDDCVTGVVWSYGSSIDLMNEFHLYGCTIYYNMLGVTSQASNATIDHTQYPLFRFRRDLMSTTGYGYWLRDVVRNGYFSYISANGTATRQAANTTGGVRPSFAIVAY